MALRMKKEGPFLRFIITTDNKAQFNSVLDLLTFRQGKLICEVCFNVLQGKFSNSDELVKKLKKPLITFLKTVGSSQRGQLNQTQKNEVIRKKKDQLFILFRYIRAELLLLLESHQQ